MKDLTPGLKCHVSLSGFEDLCPKWLPHASSFCLIACSIFTIVN